MLEVTGFVKDNYSDIPHKKMLTNTTYEDGFYFRVFVDYDDISDQAMPIGTSDSIIINAINRRYGADFYKNSSQTNLNKIKIKKVLTEFSELMQLVSDEIFNYQFIEANEVYSQGYYLAAGCVYGVAIERLLWLLIERNSQNMNSGKTEIMFMVNHLIKNNIVDRTDENRLKNAARFRNQTAHTNSYSLKLDCDILRSTLDYMVTKYFKSTPQNQI